MDRELARIFDDVRRQIAAGGEPDAAALEARVRAVDPAAVAQLRRLLAVHRAKRSLAREPAPPPSAPAPRRPAAYRARPTISANMSVRARAEGDAVVLEWEPQRGVAHWEARVSERPDAHSPYTQGETLTLDAPRLELRLTELPKRVSLTGRTAGGRIAQRALISGLTSANWKQKWQQRASAA